ncbi:EF-hand domain-containing protein [Dyella jejuensis]|uniref:EF-hand domain-containing protein n=1 Tax=Dyella jejuensis TaxID=1432009 RepID=A0ABW8JJ39_9GAMM
MIRFTCATLVLLAMAGSPSMALAQTGLNDLARNVKALDKNFDAADKNHDGLLSRQEAQAGQVPFIANHFDAIDTTHRGAVSKQEVHDYIARTLKRTARPPGASSAPSQP